MECVAEAQVTVLAGVFAEVAALGPVAFFTDDINVEITVSLRCHVQARSVQDGQSEQRTHCEGTKEVGATRLRGVTARKRDVSGQEEDETKIGTPCWVKMQNFTTRFPDASFPLYTPRFPFSTSTNMQIALSKPRFRRNW